jgi:hypothetical protein
VHEPSFAVAPFDSPVIVQDEPSVDVPLKLTVKFTLITRPLVVSVGLATVGVLSVVKGTSAGSCPLPFLFIAVTVTVYVTLSCNPLIVSVCAVPVAAGTGDFGAGVTAGLTEMSKPDTGDPLAQVASHVHVKVTVPFPPADFTSPVTANGVELSVTEFETVDDVPAFPRVLVAVTVNV